MAKGEGFMALHVSHYGMTCHTTSPQGILHPSSYDVGLMGITSYAGSFFRPLLNLTLGHRVLSTFFNLSETKLLQDLLSCCSLLSSILSLIPGGNLLYAGWRGHRGGSMVKKSLDSQTPKASTQEQAAQLIASMAGPAWGSLLNICMVVLLHCAGLCRLALHTIPKILQVIAFVVA